MGTKYVAAIDQGTSSSRCLVYDSNGAIVGHAQHEHRQIYPQPGWVEHDALEIWEKVCKCVEQALRAASIGPRDVACVGITNQRESTVVWDRHTGKPLHNVIVWNDTRTTDICSRLKAGGGGAGIDRFRQRTGLPITPYFSATKLLWLLETVTGLREAAERGDALFGTLDTWLVWQLTRGEKHVTDVTNASRTMLMDIQTLEWDPGMIKELSIPAEMLPSIHSSAEIYGSAKGLLEGAPIAGILGDQQAALFGQCCFEAGQAKCTYGTGSFVLMNTGEKVVHSTHGLLSTVGYKLGDQPCVYALEGSIAYAGSVVQWFRDNLQIIGDAAEIEPLAHSVPDNGGVYFVPAFAGLYAPYWRADARGLVCGLTAFNTKAHLARAVLEATAFQVKEVLEAMHVDSKVTLLNLKVDGGMTANGLLMQFQADVLGTQVMLPKLSETTALGAAFAAGLAAGVWDSLEQLKQTWVVRREFRPGMAGPTRSLLVRNWKRAVDKSLGWEMEGQPPPAARGHARTNTMGFLGVVVQESDQAGGGDDTPERSHSPSPLPSPPPPPAGSSGALSPPPEGPRTPASPPASLQGTTAAGGGASSQRGDSDRQCQGQRPPPGQPGWAAGLGVIAVVAVAAAAAGFGLGVTFGRRPR